MGKSKSRSIYLYQLWILCWACSGCLSCAPPSPTSLSEDSAATLSLPSDGFQALLPNYPFTCSGLLRELLVQANGDSEFELQIWRPESASETFNLLWTARYRPDYVDTDEFRCIGKNTLQWTSRVGIPIQPGDVFGLHISRSNSSMQIPHSSESSQKLYYVSSEEPLCNFALCDERVQMLNNVSLFITTTVFEKTLNFSLAEEQLSKMKAFCHKANFSNCPRIQRTKRSGMTGQPLLPISPSLPCTTPTPTPTPPPTTHSTQTNTTSGPPNPPPPPGYVIKISPEAIAFIIVGVLLLVILVVLVFVLVFCLRTKGVKVEQSASLVSNSPPRVPELSASVDSRTTRDVTASISAAERSTEVVSKRHPHQRNANHHYINGEISHRGIFSSFFPLYENTSSSPLTQSTSSHEHLRNERVFSTSALQNNRLSPPNCKPPHRARSVGPSTKLCTGIQAPPVPPRGQSRSRGGASNETHRYSVLEASTDSTPLQDRRRAQSCGGWVRTRVNKREETSHDYAEPDSPTDTKEEFVQSLKYDKLLPHEGSPQFDLSGSLVPGPRERWSRALSDDHSYSDPDGLWSSMELSCNYTYVPTEDQRRMANSCHYEMQDDFQQDSEMMYDRLRFFEERETYWAPATTESGLYTQLSENKYRELPRSEIRVTRQIGSGHFGTVSIGLWESEVNPQPVEVAIKAVKACSDLERIKLLQEAAIMGQFAHCNVVRLLGVVTVGEPALVILEYMVKGDLRSFLQKLHPKVSKRELPEVVPQLFIKFSKDIANGMGYLSKKNFVHRDLAARNILLNNDLTCKIGDFGMARDVENDYYKSHGGIIPVKWTAPEALNYNKFSSSSDVWSYGMVLFEIWSIGEKPFNELTNPIVIALVSSKHCQAPPPGCPRAIYHLMVECWNPDASKRPTFGSIHTYLDSPIENLTHWHAGDMIPDRRAHVLAAPLREANNLYLQLQRTYQKPLIGNSS